MPLNSVVGLAGLDKLIQKIYKNKTPINKEYIENELVESSVGLAKKLINQKNRIQSSKNIINQKLKLNSN